MKKRFFLGALFASILALFGSGRVFAVSGNSATISGGSWDICIATSGAYAGSSFVADVSGADISTQLVYGDFTTESCKTINLTAGNNYTVTMNKPMGVTSMSYATASNKLTFSATPALKYLNIFGSQEQVMAASKVNISFNANGGTGTMAAMTNQDLNTNITLTSNSFTKTDYRFNGWNTKADGTGTSYTDGDTVSFATGAEVELFGQWKVATAALQTGQNVNAALKTLANGSSVSYSTGDTLIKNLSFVDTLPSTVDENTPKVNIALDGEIPVYAYWVASDEAIYINTEADMIYANQNSSSMFYMMQSLTSLTLPSTFNTSNVTDMSGMFREMQALTSLTLPNSFDTSNVTDMSHMFREMKALTSLTLPNTFNTSKVTNMGAMFNSVRALTSLTLPNTFNTSNVTIMAGMFNGMRALTSFTFPSSFDTSNVTNMSGMFCDVGRITSLTLPNTFNTSSVTNMSWMFAGMQSLTSLTLPNTFNTSSVTDMSSMFAGMQSLTSLTLPNTFNTSSVTNMQGMFVSMPALTSLTLPSSFNTSNVTTMSQMFAGMQSLTTLTLPSTFSTSNVTNMSEMFAGMQSLATLTLPSSFVISAGTSTNYIFTSISNTATLYAADATARSLWPGQLGN